MNYHIGTMLIYENFKKQCDCPVCEIEKTVDDRLTDQYLGEGVMEDDTRKEVNELGFCSHHFSFLFNKQSKLGLALQTQTRLETVIKKMPIAKNGKTSKKQAKTIENLLSTCVICKYLDEHMTRYYKTIAEVYHSDKSFKDNFKNTKLCLNHLGKLLQYSDYSKSDNAEYIADLNSILNLRHLKLKEELNEFTMRHDYRNAGTSLGDGKNALKDSDNFFYGYKKQ